MEPVRTCSYCKGHDHNVEQCPQLIAKWQARTVATPNPPPKLNPNENVNVQIIVAESQQLNIVATTRGGAMTGAEQENPQEQTQLQVRPTTQKKESPIGPKQKEVFWDVQSDFISPEVPSTSTEVKDMPERFQHRVQRKASTEVSKLRPLLSSCLMLIQDKDDIGEMQ